MKITEKWLEKHKACSEGLARFRGQKETDAEAIIAALMSEGIFDWANWLLVRLLTRDDVVRYAVFAAARADKAAKAAAKDSAFYAAYAAYCAEDAAYWAARAAETATGYAKDAASYAAKAAYYAAKADRSARSAMKKAVITYGLKLLKGRRNGR